MSKLVVCVWMPGNEQMGGLGRVVRALGVGHAAIKLNTGVKKHYITWSAQGSPFDGFELDRFNKLGNGFGYNKDKQGMLNFFGPKKGSTEKERLKEENLGERSPDYKMNMPILKINGNSITYGIDSNRIEKFWMDRLQNEMRYRFISKTINCTGCVAEALRAGGLGSFVQKDKTWFVQDARTLRFWAQRGQEKLESLNQLQGSIDAVMQMLSAKHSNLLNAGVPSFDVWKRESDEHVKLRTFAQRKDQIAKLDMLIRNYPNARTDLSKFTYLIKMQSEIYSHFTTKPNSDRKEAVTKLAARVTGALRNLNLTNSAVDNLSDEAYEMFMERLAWDTETL